MKDLTVWVSVSGLATDGHSVSLPLNGGWTKSSEPGWTLYEVPRKARLNISAFSQLHGLVEHVIEVGDAEEFAPLEIDLGGHVEQVAPHVSVLLSSTLPNSASALRVNLLAPKTRHPLRSIWMQALPSGLTAPEGDYLIEARWSPSRFCAADPPDPELVIPITIPWSSKDPTPIVLRPSIGSRLKLNVIRPELPDTSSRPGPQLGGIDLGRGLRGAPQELVAIQLISLDTGKSHNLTWGWNGIFSFPRSHFPMGQEVYQVSPVPIGEYELVLRGVAIEELRQKVTLGPRSTTNLILTPRGSSE